MALPVWEFGGRIESSLFELAVNREVMLSEVTEDDIYALGSSAPSC